MKFGHWQLRSFGYCRDKHGNRIGTVEYSEGGYSWRELWRFIKLRRGMRRTLNLTLHL